MAAARESVLLENALLEVSGHVGVEGTCDDRTFGAGEDWRGYAGSGRVDALSEDDLVNEDEMEGEAVYREEPRLIPGTLKSSWLRCCRCS